LKIKDQKLKTTDGLCPYPVEENLNVKRLKNILHNLT